MKCAKIIFLPAVWCLLLVSAAAKERIIAEINGVPLSSSSLCAEAAKLLPSVGESDDVSCLKLQAAVMLEVKLRITSDLLAREKIYANSDAVKWYFSERKKRYGNLNSINAKELKKLENDRSFQLKCAVFRYIFSKFPEKLELPDGAVEAFYRQNQMQYLKNVPGKYLVVSVPSGIQGAGGTISDIRAALLQGEAPAAVSKRYNAVCKYASAEIGKRFADQNVRKHFISEPFEHNAMWSVAVCEEPPHKRFIPFALVGPLIEEELLSRRAGAAFDDILKVELSRKTIKYRR